jgi:flagellar motor switch protein FliM
MVWLPIRQREWLMSVGAESVKQKGARERTVTSCNFRASGLLSNESTRQLRSMHETFARALSHSLDLFLGSPIDVKLLKVDQIGARDFGTAVSAGSYLVPFGLQPKQERVIAKFENGLLFPLLDLLLGGPGDPLEHSRELTEIDEELFRSVTELMAAQLERVWKACNVVVAALPSVKPAMIGQLFAMEERVVTLHFEIRLATTTSSFVLVVPMSFSNALVRNGHSDAARSNGSHAGGAQRFRERMLHCSMPLSVDLRDLRVPLGDLVALEVGSVLNLRAPVQTPIVLHVSGHPIFHVTPVRCGEYKAAQLVSARQSED